MDQLDQPNFEHNLQNIPEEVFFYICSYLDSKRSLSTLSDVCESFHELLNNDFYWRTRIGGRWLPSQEGMDVDWREACSCIEEESAYLRDPPTLVNVQKFDAHSMDIHAIHILKGGKVCLSGSRENDIAVWTIDNGDPLRDENPLCVRPGAHSGWVWRITSNSPEQIYSGSFDYSVKQWSLTPSELVEVSCFKCDKAVMSLQLLPEHHLLAAGLVRGIHFLDDRLQGDRPVHILAPDLNNQLAMTTINPNVLVSTGLKRCLTFCDVRNLKETWSSDFAICPSPGHPQSIVRHLGHLYVSDTEGSLHMIDVSKNTPELLENLLALNASYTTLVTGSSTGTIRFWRHTRPPPESEKLHRPLKMVGMLQPDQDELGAMHFRDGVLAASFAKNICLNWWLPDNV
ncbi:hypothetical protein B566_EDAN011386 [Ephemera danica]|nr:hypothetical protein B566_EDAN011386 [Ephemera danica]